MDCYDLPVRNNEYNAIAHDSKEIFNLILKMQRFEEIKKIQNTFLRQ